MEVRTARGALQGRLRVTDLRAGVIFVPFHYGYWGTPAGAGPDMTTPGRAANETTITDWDPASKQPLFKTAAAALTLIAHNDGKPSPAPTTTASAPTDPHGVPATKDTRLLTLASSCHPRTLRQMRWTNTMIKNLSPQILTSL